MGHGLAGLGVAGRVVARHGLAGQGKVFFRTKVFYFSFTSWLAHGFQRGYRADRDSQRSRRFNFNFNDGANLC